ncbi:AAA-ATPase At3g50940-like [Malania oleifera]|uniref:AAA-ATPase At3g50940-like n=1 Tax=Malania oleifera TaxID=397392 RepID=UPI0025AE536E|nr:AAA-ATPase At3g50940-like [Malania oleifera]
MFPCDNGPSYRNLLAAAASLTASAVLLRNVVDDVLPDQLRQYFSSSLRNFSNRFSSHLTVVVEEFDGLTANHMFDAAYIYLGSIVSPFTRRFKVNKAEKDKDLALSVDRNQEIFDVFNSVRFKWVLVCTRVEPSVPDAKHNRYAISRSETRILELSFHKKHKEMVLKTYLPYILQKAKAIREERKAVKLHTIDYNGTDYWSSIDLDHPGTFNTIAMDPEMKKALIEDLDRFKRRKEYYRRVGRAWKRGYLLYGPPGTGKSSLVAAMANYLRYSIYDLDLKEVQCNSDLRRLLIGTASRSILVIEDIDCSVDLQNRDSEKEAGDVEDDKVTLSGLLNFIDGLWSSCGDERIIVFTTNHKDRLDPALLRPGRMDVHIHMSYCTFSGFMTLAFNYLGVEDHPLFKEIEKLLEGVQATPAEVAGELMKSDDVNVALQTLIQFLQNKKAAS